MHDVDEISSLVDTLATGRYSMVCVRARLAGEPVPELRVPCFFNPQHGPSARDVMWTSPRTGTRTVPACTGAPTSSPPARSPRSAPSGSVPDGALLGGRGQPAPLQPRLLPGRRRGRRLRDGVDLHRPRPRGGLLRGRRRGSAAHGGFDGGGSTAGSTAGAAEADERPGDTQVISACRPGRRRIGSTGPPDPTYQEPLVSEIKIAVLAADDAREERTVTTGTKAWELFTEDTDVVAARVGGELRDLAHELADGDEVEPVAIDSPDGRDILRHSTAHVLAQAVQQLWPDAKLGIGPPVENGFYYDFDVETPFVPEDLDKLETAMRKIIKENQRFERRVTTDAEALDELKDEPYKVELIGLKGGRESEDAAEGASVEVGGRRADHLRQRAPQRRRRLVRPVPRPAPADHQADPGLQADAHRRGVLARRREEQAAAADLRHRVGVQGGARRAPPPDRGGRAARPPQARPRPRPVLLPRRARVRPRGLPPQGRGDQARDGGLRPAAPHRGGVPVRRHPPHLQGRAVPHLRAPAVLRGHHVSPHEDGGCGVPAQGHELPDAQPDLRLARAVLPRAAAAALRVRRRLPVREVRGGPRPDPGPRHDPGRLPLLRHPGAGAGRDQAPARLLPGPVPGLRARRLLPRAVHPRRPQQGQVHRERRGVGRRDQGARGRRADTGLEMVPDPGGAAYYGPKISVQARDAIGRTWQLSTIQYDFNQPEGSGWSTRRPTARGSGR